MNSSNTATPEAPLSTLSGRPQETARLSRALLHLFEASFIWVVLLSGWALAARFLPLGGNPLIPAPQATFIALWDALPQLWQGTVSSFSILLPGFLLATAAGVTSGITVGTSTRMQRMFFPFSRVAAPVPPTVYVPYAIAILPTFKLSAVFVVFIGAFWPVFHNTAQGALMLEQRYRDSARVLELTPFEYRWRVVFPAALPHIFSGMGVALAFSFILLTVAELFGAHAGLGHFVQYYADFADYPTMAAGILYTGFITYLSMTALEKLKHHSLFWQR